MKVRNAVAALLLSVAGPALAQTTEPGAPPADTSAGETVTQDTAVAKLEDKDVYSSTGDELAEVDNVVLGPDKKIYVVLEFGGFLGLGQEHRLVALDELTLDGDRLVLAGRSQDDLRNLPAWDNDLEGYSELEATYMAPVKLGAEAASRIETPAPAATQPNVRAPDTPAEPDENAAKPEPATPATPANPAP